MGGRWGRFCWGGLERLEVVFPLLLIAINSRLEIVNNSLEIRWHRHVGPRRRAVAVARDPAAAADVRAAARLVLVVGVAAREFDEAVVRELGRP